MIVGVIRGAHGLRGELRVMPDTDNPERFRAGRRVLVEGAGEHQILAVRGTKTDVIIRLDGIVGRDAARALAGGYLRARTRK